VQHGTTRETVVQVSNASCVWIEGAIDATGDSYAVRMERVRFSTLREVAMAPRRTPTRPLLSAHACFFRAWRAAASPTSPHPISVSGLLTRNVGAYQGDARW
jgi:hypothetical protein